MVLQELEEELELRRQELEAYIAAYLKAEEAVRANARQAAEPKSTLARFLSSRQADRAREAA
jgi:hypothetical protein